MDVEFDHEGLFMDGGSWTFAFGLKNGSTVHYRGDETWRNVLALQGSPVKRGNSGGKQQQLTNTRSSDSDGVITVAVGFMQERRGRGVLESNRSPAAPPQGTPWWL